MGGVCVCSSNSGRKLQSVATFFHCWPNVCNHQPSFCCSTIRCNFGLATLCSCHIYGGTKRDVGRSRCECIPIFRHVFNKRCWQLIRSISCNCRNFTSMFSFLSFSYTHYGAILRTFSNNVPVWYPRFFPALFFCHTFFLLRLVS